MATLKEKILLNDSQKKIIYSYLNNDNKLSCLDAMNIAKELNLKTTQMSDACKSIDIKITNCELGVFGKLSFSNFNNNIYKDISKKFKNNTDISCSKLWNISKYYTLNEVGSTVKFSDIEVINCQLGCFNLRKEHRENKN